MTTVDHLSLGVPDIAAARRFYDRTLATLGCACLAATPGFAAYGHERVEFLVMTPFDGRTPTAGNGAHVCFSAASREAVHAFHEAGLGAGGSDEGVPGVREAYPMADAYAAYVRDPFGNKLEVIHNGFSGRDQE